MGSGASVAGGYTAGGGVMEDACCIDVGSSCPVSACALLLFPLPKHGKQLIFRFPPRLPVVVTLWGATTLAKNAKTHVQTGDVAAITAHRPSSHLSAPLCCIDLMRRHCTNLHVHLIDYPSIELPK